MVYENTIQTEALRLVAKKMQSSLAVEGELPEEGLIAFGDDGQDMIMALARQIVNETEFQSGNSLENIFARAREAEQENERYLVDDEWHTTQAGPELEMEPDETDEPDAAPKEPEPAQQSVFSWTEFMAEPVQTAGRRRSRKEPEAPSLFQWAAEQETSERQER